MREHAPDRRRAVGDAVEVLLEPVVEVELARVAELHDRTAVNVFVIEPMRYCVSGVARDPAS